MSYKYSPLKTNKYLKGKCSLEIDILKKSNPSCVLVALGNDHKTPQWKLNCDGSLFGGDHGKDLLEIDLVKMYEFIAREAQVVGYWETVNGNGQENPNPYNEKLLDGLPQNEWAIFYEEGSHHARFERSALELSKRYS